MEGGWELLNLSRLLTYVRLYIDPFVHAQSLLCIYTRSCVRTCLLVKQPHGIASRASLMRVSINPV